MTNKPGEMAAEIPEVIKDPTKPNACYERGRFLGKVTLECFAVLSCGYVIGLKM